VAVNIIFRCLTKTVKIKLNPSCEIRTDLPHIKLSGTTRNEPAPPSATLVQLT